MQVTGKNISSYKLSDIPVICTLCKIQFLDINEEKILTMCYFQYLDCMLGFPVSSFLMLHMYLTQIQTQGIHNYT